MPTKFVPFRPALEGRFGSRFYRQIRESIESGDVAVSGRFSEIARAEVAWSSADTNGNPVQHAIFRACWMLLRDLQRLGWRFYWRNNEVVLGKPELSATPDSPEEVITQKLAIQDAMSFAREDRLRQFSDFTRRMVLPADGQSGILNLIADGRDVAGDLQRVLKTPDRNKRQLLLEQLVRPYLQLVTNDGRCEFTGIRLAEIWRFFRFTWANPPESTPGRTMLYLIRDSARHNHPVMGIISLENSALRISCRDEFLGWTPEAFVASLDAVTTSRRRRSRFEFLIKSLDGGIEDIDFRGLCRKKDIDSPNEAVILKLAGIARESDDERITAMQAWNERSDNDSDTELSELGNISLAVEEALYRRKRADQLSRFLSAKLKLQGLLQSGAFGSEVDDFTASEAGLSAIRTALIANKNKHIGTSILELNVCGAIPPYNEILGGKLAALLAASPTVISDYRRRYGSRPSDIASRMKGEPVIRPAQLVYIGTSSLYAGCASQYNRLRIPKDVFASSEEIVWRRLGTTAGYGTLHISRDTLNALENALVAQGKVSRANHIFGEGASPKFRSIRSGIEAILVPRCRAAADAIGRHEMRRIVYGCMLAANGLDILANTSSRPQYYFDRKLSHTAGTQRIAQYWLTRWVGSRINFKPAMERLSSFDAREWLKARSMWPDSSIQ